MKLHKMCVHLGYFWGEQLNESSLEKQDRGDLSRGDARCHEESKTLNVFYETSVPEFNDPLHSPTEFPLKVPFFVDSPSLSFSSDHPIKK